MNRLVRESIITRNKELLKNILNCQDDLSLFKILTNYLIKLTAAEPEDFKQAITFSNYIINFFYLILHDYSEDFSKLETELIKLEMGLKTKRLELLTQEITDNYHLLRNIEKRLTSFHELLKQYCEYNNENCEYDLLSYLITDVKSYEYFELLIKKNPSLLSLEKESEFIFDFFIKRYLKAIINNEDLTFYQRVLQVMLENKELVIKQQTLNEIKKLLTDSSNLEYKNITDAIESYFPDFDLAKRSTIHCLLSEKPTIPEYKRPIQVGIRLDLRKYETISIDSSIYKENGEHNIFDDAFTLFKTGNGYMLYLHFADAPSYVFPNETLNEDLKNRLFSLHNGYDYIPLFNDEFVNNYLSLKPNIDRFAITIACEINNFGSIEGVNFYESIIRNKKAFTSEEVDEIIAGKPSNYTGLIEEYAQVLNLLTDKKENIGQLIPQFFNVLAGQITAEYFKEQELPFIYRNCVPIKRLTKEEQKQMFSQFISRRVGESYLDGISEEINRLVRVYYDVVNVGHSGLNIKAYGEVSKPLRNYIAIATLYGIKRMVVKQVTNKKLIEEFYQEYQDLAIRANVIETVLQKKS